MIRAGWGEGVISLYSLELSSLDMSSSWRQEDGLGRDCSCQILSIVV